MATSFDEHILAEAILKRNETRFTPQFHECMGRFREKHWNSIKIPIIEATVFAKFWCCNPPGSPKENVLLKLLRTGDRYLFYAVEDTALLGTNELMQDIILNNRQWASMPGTNALGNALMAIRRGIKGWLGPVISQRAPSLSFDPREEAIARALQKDHLLWEVDTGRLIIRDGIASMSDEYRLRKQAYLANDALETTPDTGFGLNMRRLREALP